METERPTLQWLWGSNAKQYMETVSDLWSITWTLGVLLDGLNSGVSSRGECQVKKWMGRALSQIITDSVSGRLTLTRCCAACFICMFLIQHLIADVSRWGTREWGSYMTCSWSQSLEIAWLGLKPQLAWSWAQASSHPSLLPGVLCTVMAHLHMATGNTHQLQDSGFTRKQMSKSLKPELDLTAEAIPKEPPRGKKHGN